MTAEQIATANAMTELALAYITDALGLTAVLGWNDWSLYAARGEWF